MPVSTAVLFVLASWRWASVNGSVTTSTSTPSGSTHAAISCSTGLRTACSTTATNRSSSSISWRARHGTAGGWTRNSIENGWRKIIKNTVKLGMLTNLRDLSLGSPEIAPMISTSSGLQDLLFLVELVVEPISAVSDSSIVSLPWKIKKTSRCSFRRSSHRESQQYQQLYPFSFGRGTALLFFYVPSSSAQDQ